MTGDRTANEDGSAEVILLYELLCNSRLSDTVIEEICCNRSRDMSDNSLVIWRGGGKGEGGGEGKEKEKESQPKLETCLVASWLTSTTAQSSHEHMEA